LFHSFASNAVFHLVPPSPNLFTVICGN